MMFSKDARLPVQLQRAMAAEAEAAREARAKVSLVVIVIITIILMIILKMMNMMMMILREERMILKYFTPHFVLTCSGSSMLTIRCHRI